MNEVFLSSYQQSIASHVVWTMKNFNKPDESILIFPQGGGIFNFMHYSNESKHAHGAICYKLINGGF